VDKRFLNAIVEDMVKHTKVTYINGSEDNSYFLIKVPYCEDQVNPMYIDLIIHRPSVKDLLLRRLSTIYSLSRQEGIFCIEMWIETVRNKSIDEY
jgi:hypothetical protein